MGGNEEEEATGGRFRFFVRRVTGCREGGYVLSEVGYGFNPWTPY